MRGYANFRVSDSSGPFCLFSILWFCCPVRIEDFFLLCYFWDELPPWKVVGAMPSLTPLTRCYTRFKTLFKTAYLLLCDEQNWCVPFQCKPPPPSPVVTLDLKHCSRPRTCYYAMNKIGVPHSSTSAILARTIVPTFVCTGRHWAISII